MSRIPLLALAVTLFPSLACMPAMMAGHSAAPAAAAPAAGADATGTQACPMAVPGAQVVASDTAAGEALTFTTASGDVAELRRRVDAMAAMHGRDHAAGAGMGHMHCGMGHGGGMMGGGPAGAGSMGSMGGGSMEGGGEGAGGNGMHGMAMPPSHAAVENVENGARIVVVPDAPADLDGLRAAVRTHAQHMQRHGCAMMGGM